MNMGTSLAELQQKLGKLPSVREWCLYETIRIENYSTYQAAQDFKMSPTRICQIVRRCEAFIAEAVPIPSKEDAARDLVAAKQLQADRVDHLYCEVMTAYRASQGTETITRRYAGHDKIDCTITRTCRGEPKYIQLALKVAEVASTLPLPRKYWQMAAEEAAAAESLQRTTKPARPATKEAVQTCSPVAEKVVESVPEPAAPLTATAAAMESCIESSRGDVAVENTFSPTVHSSQSSSPRKPLTPRQAARREAFLQMS